MAILKLLSVALLLTWVGLYVGYGTRLMRRDNADKERVLSGYLNCPVVVVWEEGASIKFERPMPGIVRAVDRRGVSLEEANGRVVFLRLGGIRALDDDTGRCVAEWSGHKGEDD